METGQVVLVWKYSYILDLYLMARINILDEPDQWDQYKDTN
jgi:hypothetical protein